MLFSLPAARATAWFFVLSVIGTITCGRSYASVLRHAPPAPGEATAAGSPAWNSSLGIPVATGSRPQVDPVAIADGLGGVIIAFEDRRKGQSDVYVQRLAADGSRATGWADGGLTASVAEGDQYFPLLVEDGSGGAYVAWEDARGGRTAIFTQHVTGDGRTPADWPIDGLAVCSAEYTQSNASIAADGRGGLLVAWQDDRNGAPSVYVQQIAPEGTIGVGWRTNGVPVAHWAGNQGLPRVTSDGFGGAFVSWEDARSGQVTAYLQRISFRGQRPLEWPANGMAISPSIGRQDLVRLVADGGGGVVAVWRDWRRGTPDLIAQRVLGDGTMSVEWPTTGLTLTSAPGHRAGLEVVPDGVGGYVAVWEDYRSGAGAELYAQRVTNDGSRPAGWPLQGIAVASGGAFQIDGTIVPDGGGGFYCMWQDFTDDGSYVHGQRLLADGKRPAAWPAEGLRLTSAPDGQLAPAVAAGAGNGPILVWEEGYANPSVHAARIGAGGLHPAQIAVVDTEAEPTRIRVRWRSAPGASFRATIERSAPQSDWTGIESVTPDAAGEISYEDLEVTEGQRYGYRVAVFRDEGLVRDGEVWIETPRGAPQLALGGFVPNPARHGLIVSFSLPTTGAATIDLIDVTGRRMRSHDVGALGPGRHVVNLGGSVPPGFYIVRLSYAGQTLTARGTVMR